MIKVCVVGAGFTGWLTAVALKKNCPKISVTLIDSPTETKNIGFGESCPPFFVNWLYSRLKIIESTGLSKNAWLKKFLLETKSTIKASAKWQNWTAEKDQAYYVPFVTNLDSRNLIGDASVNDREYYRLTDLWYELYMQGDRELRDFDKDIGVLWHGLSQNKAPYRIDDGTFDYDNYLSLHISSGEVMKWFEKNYAHELDNVLKITVNDAALTQNGSIQSITDEQGTVHKFDLFVDCTGFKRVMSRYVDFDWRAADSKILHTSSVIMSNGYTDRNDMDQQLTSYTSFHGMRSGWSWEIPLMNRKSYGYVFDRDFISDQDAIDELVQVTGTDKIVQDPFVIHWQTGWNHKSWSHNVITTGMASGFIDALDANSIAIHAQQLNLLIVSLNDIKSVSGHRDDFNNTVNDLFNELIIRQDFHFALAPRNDTEYWQRNKTLHQQDELIDHIYKILDRSTPALKTNFGYKFNLFMDMVYYTYFVYYGIDMQHRCRHSDARLKFAAMEYFKTKEKIGVMGAQRFCNHSDWLADLGVDIDSLFIKA